MSKKFRFKKEEAKNSLKVFLWSLSSVLVVFLIDLLNTVDLHSEYAFIVPIANTILYAVKEFISTNELHS